MNYWSLAHIAAALTLSPLLPGIINRVKAFFGGRKGRPLLQAYYDMAKLDAPDKSQLPSSINVTT